MDAGELLDLNHKALLQQLEQTKLLVEKHLDFSDRVIMQQAALLAMRQSAPAAEASTSSDPTI